MNDLRLQNIMELMQELLPILLSEDEEPGGDIASKVAGDIGEELPEGEVAIEIAAAPADDFDDSDIDSADIDLDTEDEEDKHLYRNLLRDLK